MSRRGRKLNCDSSRKEEADEHKRKQKKLNHIEPGDFFSLSDFFFRGDEGENEMRAGREGGKLLMASTFL